MAYKLAKANQISIWLENQLGFDKYMAKYPNNPQYFLHFSDTDPTSEAMEDLEEGLDWCRDKIKGIPTTKEYGFTFVQNVKNGKAGACYTYPDPPMQTIENLQEIEQNILDMCMNWANENNAAMEVYYNQGNDKYMVVALQLPGG